MSKIGRNDKCPCGSGKKYKKCCLGKETSAVESIMKLVNTEEPAAGTKTESAALPEPKITLTTLKKKVTRDLKWEHPSHEQLALHLIETMRESYDRELIWEGLVLWNGYSRHNKPAVKKMGSFCAAIEFILSEQYGFSLTQADLAVKHEVTAPTISRKVKEMLNYVEQYGMGGAEEELLLVNVTGSPKDQAQALLQKAMQTGVSKRRIQLAEAALEVYPDNPDAYLVLAEEAENETEARAFLKSGMEAGARELGEVFFTKNKGYFWGLTETRPYIRICKSYADSCWFSGNAEEASKTLEHILMLNPEDNTGARYLLTATYLYTGKLKEAEQVLEKFGKDAAATVAYDRMILEYKKNGITSNLKMLYRVAKNVNKHVPDYLLGLKRLPHNLPDFVGMGDANEAIEYVIVHSRLWTSLPDLVKWMLKQQD